jgi:hypothetical protein
VDVVGVVDRDPAALGGLSAQARQYGLRFRKGDLAQGPGVVVFRRYKPRLDFEA